MATPESVAPDAAEREAALDPATSFIVQAPAGSGKTELLIRRILTLLPTLESPEELLAITFTRKAAAEMRQRLLDALTGARQEEPVQRGAHARTTWALARAALAHDRHQGWNLLDNPGRLRLQTIDALCAALCRRMPLAAGAGAAHAATDDASALYREAARRTLLLLADESPWQAPLQRLLAHLDNDTGQAEALLIGMLESRDRWLRHVADPASPRLERATLEAALRRLIEDHLVGLRAMLPADLAGELLQLARVAAGNLPADALSPIAALRHNAALPGAAPEDVAAWKGVAELLLTGKGQRRKRHDQKLGFPSPKGREEKLAANALKERMRNLLDALEGGAFLPALHAARGLPPPTYDDAQWRALDAMLALLPVLAAQLALVFDESRQVDHAAVQRAALDALGDEQAPTDLALALDYRIRHILVDEFQDTSHGQFQLLERLTAGWQAGDGRTVFLVGDPMQSIYRFREADVGLYLRARDSGIGGVRLRAIRLRANFRAQAGLVDWINNCFARIFPPRDDTGTGAVSYAPGVAVLAEEPHPAVRVRMVTEGGRLAEARAVADIIQRAQQADRDGSIALLVSARPHLRPLLPVLRERGIAVSAHDIEPLGERAAVRDLLALTRALLHPADRIAWLSVLRAPWCGLQLADLEVIAACSTEQGHTLPYTLLHSDWRAQVSAQAIQCLHRVTPVLSGLLAQRQRGTLARQVEGAWLALGGPANLDAEYELADAEAFIDLLGNLETSTGIVDLDQLQTRIDKLYAQARPAGPGTVQVMTMHGAKGLEFDTVIVPGLGNTASQGAQQLLRWHERARPGGPADLLLAPLGEGRTSDDGIYQALQSMDRLQGANEACRQLYVAATRARRALYLLGSLRVSEDGDPLPPRAGSLLHRLWPAIQGGYEVADAAAATPAPRAEAPPDLKRLALDWRPPPSLPLVAWPATAPVAGHSAPIEFSWASHTARVIGILVHRALQRISADGLAAWPTSAVAKLEPALRARMRSEGVAEPDVDAALSQALRALRNVLDDGRGRWLLQAHPQAHSELRITAVLDGVPVTVAMDRTFVDSDGVRWVIDYKTGMHEGAGAAAFLDSEQARYRGQMERYARALRLAGETRVIRLALYFPMMQGWREWQAPAPPA